MHGFGLSVESASDLEIVLRSTPRDQCAFINLPRDRHGRSRSAHIGARDDGYRTIVRCIENGADVESEILGPFAAPPAVAMAIFQCLTPSRS